jgi:hypothetical protein
MSRHLDFYRIMAHQAVGTGKLFGLFCGIRGERWTGDQKEITEYNEQNYYGFIDYSHNSIPVVSKNSIPKLSLFRKRKERFYNLNWLNIPNLNF